MNHNMIVIVPDDALRPPREAGHAGQKNVDGRPLYDVASSLIPAIAIYRLLSSALDNASRNGLDITKISRQEASTFIFPPGHPRDGVIYVKHPAAENVYFTAASFHRLVFEHKVTEAVTILMSLGATEIFIEHVQGWSREFAATLQVPISKAGVDVSGSGQNTGNSSILYKAHLRGTTNPQLPNSLVWYAHEPTWQAIADGRRHYGLSEFSLAVNYQDDYGINAKLKAAAQQVDLNLGGAFQDHQATTWSMRGKFLMKP